MFYYINEDQSDLVSARTDLSGVGIEVLLCLCWCVGWWVVGVGELIVRDVVCVGGRT